MTQEGMRPFTPLTTRRLRELLDELTQESKDMSGFRYGVLSATDIHSMRHAVAELIDLREQIIRIAANCPHVETIRALNELVGSDE